MGQDRLEVISNRQFELGILLLIGNLYDGNFEVRTYVSSGSIILGLAFMLLYTFPSLYIYVHIDLSFLLLCI